MVRSFRNFLIPVLLSIGITIAAPAEEGCAQLAKFAPPPDKLACIEVEVQNGNDKPLDVAAKCGLVEWAIEDVAKLIEGTKRAEAARKAGLKHYDPALIDAGSD